MKQLSTRAGLAGLTRRRYETPDGRRHNTFEVPETVLRRLGMARLEEEMSRWRRGEAVRTRAAELRAAVLDRPGWKAVALAHELGVTEAHVHKIRRDARGE